MNDVGALVRAERKRRGMTQAELATRLGTGRDWVVRLEKGNPRLEAQRVLDALVVLSMPLRAGGPTDPDQKILRSDEHDQFKHLFAANARRPAVRGC